LKKVVVSNAELELISVLVTSCHFTVFKGVLTPAKLSTSTVTPVPVPFLVVIMITPLAALVPK
jgi:hypothetical protein